MKKLAAIVWVLASAGMIGGTTGCATDDSGPLTYDQFKEQAYRDTESGLYVVNGDEIAEDEAQLEDAYWAYRGDVDALAAGQEGTLSEPLIVNRVSNRDDKWSSTAAANITFCVSQSSFGSHYNAVVTAMNSASAAWEATARVNFVHATAQDSSCTSRNNSVVFDVRQVSGGSFLARSFFPSSTRRSRELQIDSTSFGTITPYTLAGIVRHELGHTLGFRHEHTRPEAGTCFEDNNWRALTVYDSASVMHYPQCNGTNRGDLVLTSLDKQGARSLYP